MENVFEDLSFYDCVISSDGWRALFFKIDSLQQTLNNTATGTESYIHFRKEHSYLISLSYLYKDFVEIKKQISVLDCQLLNEPSQEFVQLINEEKLILLKEEEIKKKKIEDRIFINEEDEANSLFLEIRAGTGGLESSLFAADLSRLYLMYAQKKMWPISILDSAETDIGGFREITLHIEGKEAYRALKFESGVHRVQRVPKTEGAGRIHTSTITVAVLPEVKDEIEIKIDSKDLRIDTYRASGAGGQHVNKTDSAVRITHLPSGLVVACQDERSQHKNKAKAMKVLQSRLYAQEKKRVDEKMAAMRQDMAGSADRCDKIRTYNYPQNRITDHRIGLTLKNLDCIMQGDLDEISEALSLDDEKNKKVNNFFAYFMEDFKIN
jgi:peptide chain release factor 1